MGNDYQVNDASGTPQSAPPPPVYPELRAATALPSGHVAVYTQAPQPQPTFTVCPQVATVSLAPGASGAILAADGYTFTARSQQVVPLLGPATFVNLNASQYTAKVDDEPAEAVVARPLSILSLFCFLQIWFSIPAIVLACKRNKPKSVYNTSIALSITAIVLGMGLALMMLIFGMLIPWPITYYYCGNSDYYSDYHRHYDDDVLKTSTSTNYYYSAVPRVYSTWLLHYYTSNNSYYYYTTSPYYYPWVDWVTASFSSTQSTMTSNGPASTTSSMPVNN